MRKLSVFYEHILQACEQSGKTIPEVLAFCREQGISAVEMNYSLFASEREVIAPMLSDAGLVISCMHETFDFSHDTDLGRAQQMLDTAASQQVSRVLFVAGALETAEASELAACSSTYEATSTFMAKNKSIQNMVHALSSLAEYAALRGVSITLEDFDGFYSRLHAHIRCSGLWSTCRGCGIRLISEILLSVMRMFRMLPGF